jgi:excisionase family DNA binding protein
MKAAGEFLGGISRHTVRAWIRQGRLQRVRIGRRVMLTQADLERFVTSCNKKLKK